MGKYRTYSEYKDTDIEWLGLTPSRWVVSRIKFTSTLNPPKSEIRGLPEHTEITFLPMEAIGEAGSLDTGRTKKLADVLEGYSYVADGDVMIAKITPCFENGKGAIAERLRNGLGFATTEVIVVRPDNHSDSRFLYYLLAAEPFRSIAEGSMYGAGGQKRVADSFVANYSIGWPSCVERTQIAAFLDHETARIDTLIAKQERLIVLLKEKRQAVISHAVTKGLNPDAPMKDSGVEWLGEVPAHWPIVKLGYFSRVLNGSTPDRNNVEYWEDGDVPWLSSSAMNDYHVTSPSEFVTRKALVECSIGLIPQDSVLVGLVGQGKTRGLSALLKFDTTINQNVAAIIPRRDRVSSRFLHLFVQSIYKPLRDFGRGGNQAALNNELVAALRMALPPKEEQDNIVEHVEKRLGVIDVLMEKAQHSISLMQEHRTALISAAVTGKIDLRDSA